MLELIFQGFFEWLYGLVLESWEYFSSSLLDIMSMDFAYLQAHIPILTTVRQSMLAVGWALLIGNLVFQAARSMMTGLGFEAEDPKLLFTRSFVFSFLLVASPQICDLCLNMTSKIIELMEVPNAVNIQLIQESAFDGLACAWLLVFLCGIIVMFQSFRLIFEMAERYFILAVLTITAPLAFGVGGSRNTSDIFTGWCRMYGSICLLMVLNVVFVKMLLSVLSAVPTGLAVLPWIVLVLTIVKVAKKADAIVARIGLNPAATGDALGGRSLPGMLTVMVARTAAANAAKAVGKNFGQNNGGKTPTTPGGPKGGGGGQTGGAGAQSRSKTGANQTAQQHTSQNTSKQEYAAQTSETNRQTETAKQGAAEAQSHGGTRGQTRRTSAPGYGKQSFPFGKPVYVSAEDFDDGGGMNGSAGTETGAHTANYTDHTTRHNANSQQTRQSFTAQASGQTRGSVEQQSRAARTAKKDTSSSASRVTSAESVQQEGKAAIRSAPGNPAADASKDGAARSNPTRQTTRPASAEKLPGRNTQSSVRQNERAKQVTATARDSQKAQTVHTETGLAGTNRKVNDPSASETGKRPSRNTHAITQSTERTGVAEASSTARQESSAISRMLSTNDVRTSRSGTGPAGIGEAKVSDRSSQREERPGRNPRPVAHAAQEAAQHEGQHSVKTAAVDANRTAEQTGTVGRERPASFRSSERIEQRERQVPGVEPKRFESAHSSETVRQENQPHISTGAAVNGTAPTIRSGPAGTVTGRAEQAQTRKTTRNLAKQPFAPHLPGDGTASFKPGKIKAKPSRKGAVKKDGRKKHGKP